MTKRQETEELLQKAFSDAARAAAAAARKAKGTGRSKEERTEAGDRLHEHNVAKEGKGGSDHPDDVHKMHEYETQSEKADAGGRVEVKGNEVHFHGHDEDLGDNEHVTYQRKGDHYHVTSHEMNNGTPHKIDPIPTHKMAAHLKSRAEKWAYGQDEEGNE